MYAIGMLMQGLSALFVVGVAYALVTLHWRVEELEEHVDVLRKRK